ncbi:transducin (beta) 3-like protein (nucleomorph) [Cryptomonas paramecium]|uniref:Transducin (Beta) 3-like protein n=1 Tax=Cryptomonas paramaecium TaxID=2898 RepID=F2HHZ1_9CRYP|nr:transducin (beta) 3-like protein [Cryptomonas paramecium]AEA38937.1 transducin (beta) 3-like protein [Cryptomonas paramecium]|mmetsp:Transcript_52418/g.137239  ORF Transcript_52418/g.137239 Transcript_52418/m.137239 type:complete len:758 (-) Transcript_52418:1377-3650(-)
MPFLKTDSFSFQEKKLYKILSKSINTFDNFHEFFFKKIFLNRNFLILGTVFFNKVYIFSLVKQKIKLLNLLEESSELIILTKVSATGKKIVTCTKKNKIFLYIICFFGKKNKNIKYYKKLEIYKEKKILSICFDQKELLLIISYENGGLSIFNTKKKTFIELNINISFEKFHICHQDFVTKIIGKTSFGFFIQYDLFDKKILYKKKADFFMTFENLVLLQSQKKLQVRCICHDKKLVNIKLFIIYPIFAFINQSAVLIYHEFNFFYIKLSSKKILKYKENIFLNKFLYTRKKSVQQFFIYNNNLVNFVIILHLKLDIILFSKAISENRMSLYIYNSQFCNLRKIHDVKFVNEECSLLVATDDQDIRLYHVKSFYLKGLFSFQNSFFLKIETKGNLLMANSSAGKIVFWKIDRFCLLTSINISNENTNIFSLFKQGGVVNFFISGGKDCIVKLWKFHFKSIFDLKVDLLGQRKMEKSKICLISTHESKSIFAVASECKKIFLWKKSSKNPYLVINKFRKSIWCLNFSRKKNWLVTGLSNGDIFFFDLSDGSCLKKLHDHTGSITNCVLSLDDFYLYTSNSKGEMKIWKIKPSTCTNVIRKNKNCIWAFAFSTFQNFIIVGYADGTLIFIKQVESEFPFKQKLKFKIFNLTRNSNVRKESCFILTHVLNFNDSKLLFKFLICISDKFSPLFENIILFLSNLNTRTLQFFFKCMLTWNVEKEKACILKKILIAVERNFPFFSINFKKKILNFLDMSYLEG